MTTNSYLEYFLTLLGWVVNNGLWDAISATGLFALPLLIKLLALWLQARSQGADEGNKAAAVAVMDRAPDVHLVAGYYVHLRATAEHRPRYHQI